MLLSFSVSLWFFNHGHVFAAMSLAYPPLAWLLLRCVWIARRDTPSRGMPVWPVWLLAAATVFVAGFRIGLNVRASNVIDVGYSGIIGADRIVHGQSPYGHFPVEDPRPKCGPADTEGEVRDRVQTNGRCETANPLGDTYGPVSYLAYIPGYAIFGWSHKWDGLPGVHLTSILFDTICLIGLALVGRRFGGAPLAAALAFAWVTWPFSQYASSSNTNDSIAPALLVWGFLALTSPVARGVAVALSGWTKFASLLLLPLWSGYPEARRPRSAAVYLAAFALTTLLVFFVVFLEPSPLHAVRVFYDRTVSFQIGRDSPFSHLGLAAVPREGHPRPAPRAARPAGAARRRLARARVVPAPPLAPPARGADGSGARRLRARADALVLPLSPVVLPLRRARARRRSARRAEAATCAGRG